MRYGYEYSRTKSMTNAQISLSDTFWLSISASLDMITLATERISMSFREL